MTTYDKPAWLRLAQIEWGIQKAGVQFEGPYNGTLQAVDFVAERWVVSLSLARYTRDEVGAVEAFFNRLAGGVNRVRLWHAGSGTKKSPGIPRGTLRGSPTTEASAARGAPSLSLNCAPGATLMAGDMIGCNAQLFQVADDATADGSGVMAVSLVNRLRVATDAGTAVVWNRPTAEFVMPSMSARHTYAIAMPLAGQFDLQEVW